jgi:hypothetical protein
MAKAMNNDNIDISEMSHEESVSHFNCLENLGKIRRTNGLGPATYYLQNSSGMEP